MDIYQEIESLLYRTAHADINQLFLLLVFATQSDVEVKLFLITYTPNRRHIFALYLIFPNGVRYSEEWISNESVPKLQWCRSFSTRLIEDIREMCKSACDRSINFYQQRLIEVEDSNQNNTNGSLESIVVLRETMIERFAALLREYYSNH